MRRRQLIGIVGIACLFSLSLGGLGASLARRRLPTGVRESRFFRVDMDQRKVLGPSERVAAALNLELLSVSTDQPQYWPNEKVYLKVLALGRSGAAVTGRLQKRDGIGTDIKGTLDEQGALVLVVLDGEKERLELGEYRLDVTVGDKAKAAATFAVVQGTLGALSFAHEFKKVTRPEKLDPLPGGWYLGNAAAAGARWGNGLSFKNELRVSNRAYDGDVEVHSRCMLPGCNGVEAGPAQAMRAHKGVLQGTLDIRGHSGPFQIEVVTPRGSLRHQFEGSSHVERDMVAVAGGVSFSHRAGLAPYEKTTQVPGRDLFVESKRAGDDPFLVESVIAQGGRLKIAVQKAVRAPLLVVHNYKAGGGFSARTVPLGAELKPGRTLEVEVEPPYSLVSIGGFVGPEFKEFKEGWALGFVPAQLQLVVEAPADGRALGKVPVVVRARDGAGKAARVSVLVEVYDNRVPSRSPAALLGSAIGDSMRSASQSVSRWVDGTGWIEEPDPEPRARPRPPAPRSPVPTVTKKEVSVMGYGGLGLSGGGTGDAMIGLGSIGTIGHGSGKASGAGYGAGAGVMATPRLALPSRPGGGSAPAQELLREEVREGERKVVLCERIVTDDNGEARLEVTLPPQLGRVVVRAVAARGLDYTATQRELDVRRDAGVEPHLPRTFVPGAELLISLDAVNQTRGPLVLSAQGAGLPQPIERPVAVGNSTIELPLSLRAPGTLVLKLRGADGQVLDQREQVLQTVAELPVTSSRLVFGEGAAVQLAAGESARVYAGTGPLLRGLVMNVETTVQSWFGHAEALSARAAVRATLLAAIHKGLLSDEGLGHQLRTGIDKDVRDLGQVFCGADGLCRPYPGVPPSPVWSGWVARNLAATARALEQAGVPDVRVKTALVGARSLSAGIRAALLARGLKLEELAGINADGEDVVPVELDGQVAYRVLTDDAVTRWASERLLPRLDLDQQSADVALSRAYDTFRFLRAFERVGALQYLTELATAYYLKGDLARFARLYRQVARGLILTQEPGLLQGPALLGGVYSTPMALVRFLELQLLVGQKQKAANVVVPDGRPLAFEQVVRGPAALPVPAGAIARIDQRGTVRLEPSPPSTSPGARVTLSRTTLRPGEELELGLTLDGDRDPLEHYAIVVAPTTTSIKQTADVLSDYHGQLIYGQQGQGGTQMQLVVVPFRGARSMRLVLEGAYRGRAPGLVLIRHIEGALRPAGVAVPDVTVR
jgi:hypothetical protein